MKKTLIALVVAASAAVSGSAMAWSPAGSGGEVSVGGILSVIGDQNPWTVAVGASVHTLNASLKHGEQEVSIMLPKNIPVIGMQVKDGDFMGHEGVSPKLSYGKGVDLSKLSNGVAPVHLDIKSSDGSVIGSMDTQLKIAAEGMEASFNSGAFDYRRHMLFADKPGEMFVGGVAQNAEGVMKDEKAAEDFMHSMFSDIASHWSSHGSNLSAPGAVAPVDLGRKYNGMYASGFTAGDTVTIKLNKPVEHETAWQAVLPILVSYA